MIWQPEILQPGGKGEEAVKVISDLAANEEFACLIKKGILKELHRNEMLTDTQLTNLLNRIK